jgi:hypothetical protein
MVMRYRQLSPAGDYIFGQGLANFFADSPEAVGQAIKTRLLLFAGEWFLDNTEGTPYATDILGQLYGQTAYDTAIRSRISTTPNVTEVVAYSSQLVARKLTVDAIVNTTFGQLRLVIAL